MSYITVDAARVIDAVDEALAWIQVQKDHRQANMIRRYATKRRWFGLAKPWGYQRAFEYLEDSGDMFDHYSMIQEVSYGNMIDDLKALRRLAVESTETVNVSADMSYIFD